MAMCPHGTSSALRGSSRQTAHGSRSSAAGAGSSADGGLGVLPEADATSGDGGGVFSPEGEPGVPNFLRRPRRGSDVIGSGHRKRWRDW